MCARRSPAVRGSHGAGSRRASGPYAPPAEPPAASARRRRTQRAGDTDTTAAVPGACDDSDPHRKPRAAPQVPGPPLTIAAAASRQVTWLVLVSLTCACRVGELSRSDMPVGITSPQIRDLFRFECGQRATGPSARRPARKLQDLGTLTRRNGAPAGNSAGSAGELQSSGARARAGRAGTGAGGCVETRPAFHSLCRLRKLPDTFKHRLLQTSCDAETLIT